MNFHIGNCIVKCKYRQQAVYKSNGVVTTVVLPFFKCFHFMLRSAKIHRQQTDNTCFCMPIWIWSSFHIPFFHLIYPIDILNDEEIPFLDASFCKTNGLHQTERKWTISLKKQGYWNKNFVVIISHVVIYIHTHTYIHTYMFVVVNFDALAQASDIRIERRQVVFLCWMQDSNPSGSQTPNRQQTECPLTNRLSYRGSS